MTTDYRISASGERYDRLAYAGCRVIGQRATALLERASVHDQGCYFMCFPVMCWEYMDASVDVRPADILRAYDHLTRTGAMGDDCFVVDPQKVADYWADGLKYLGHRDHDYKLADNERAIERWELQRSGGGIWGHFVYGHYDPWSRSLTRRTGELVGLRVFRER